MKLLVDENFRGAIVRGLLRRRPDFDLVRVFDVGLGEADDPTILAWAATEGRLVLTHDAATLVGFAYDRVAAGQAMPGIIGSSGLPVKEPTFSGRPRATG